MPLNAELFRFRQPDGVERIMRRDVENPLVLHGPSPWVGLIRPERRMINVFTSPEFKGEKTEYGFVDGVLRFMSVGEKDYAFNPSDYATPTNSVTSLWPSSELTEAEQAGNDMWRGGTRMRLFSRNPNRAALIFVQFLLIALGVALFATSRVWRLHGVLWTLIAALLTFGAQSRGGFLAAFAGVVLLVACRVRRGMSRGMLAAVLGIGLLLGGFAVVTRTGERVTVGLVESTEDRSSQNRLAIWKEVPRMLAVAPWGWGLWQSGPAYNSWFEKPERMHLIGDLFNDHLSRVVEGGLLGGGAYVFLWVFLLMVTGRQAWRGGSPVPLAIVVSYAIASAFNPMNYWAPSFVLPTLVGGWMVWRDRPQGVGRSLLLSVAAAALAVTAVWGCAKAAPPPDVPLRVGLFGRTVIVGEGEPKVWVADDGFVLNGDYNGFPGREIRAYYRAHPQAEAMGIVEDLTALPRHVEKLLVTGRLCEDYLRQADRLEAEHVVLLTPPFAHDRITDELRKGADLHVLTGSLVARLTGDETCGEPWVHVVAGAEAYVPGWLDLMVKKTR